MALSEQELARLRRAGTAGGQPLPVQRPLVEQQQQGGIFSQQAESLFGKLGLGGRRGDMLGRLFGNVLPPSKKQKELLQLQLENQAQTRTRARQGAVQEFASASGISPQGVAVGAGFDRQLQGVLEATARGEEGGRQGLQALAEQSIRKQLASARGATSEARSNLPLAIQQQVDETQREVVAQNIGNRRDFIADVEGNPALTKGIGSLVAASQLLDTISDPGFTALDLTTDAVLFTQVIEPGLAVREDDRMAFTRGATSGFETLKNIANQFALGEITGEEAGRNVRASLFSIMRTPAQRMQQSLEFWQNVGSDIPGVQQGDVLGASGVTPRMIEQLQQFGLNPFEQER